MNENRKCHYCGGGEFEDRRMRYVYSRKEKHLFVPDMPVDVCLSCGMIFYHGPALLRVEEQFKAIYERHEPAARYTQMPVLELVAD